MKKIITILILSSIGLSHAGIRVYDKTAGGDVEVNSKAPVSQPNINTPSNLNLKNFAEELRGEINAGKASVEPTRPYQPEGKPIKEKSISELSEDIINDINAGAPKEKAPLGKAMIFISTKKLTKQLNSRLAKLAKKTNLELEIYMEGMDPVSYFKVLGGAETDFSPEFPFQIDLGKNVARYNKADNYRTIIYTAPDKSTKRYDAITSFQLFLKDLKKVEKAVSKQP